MLAKLLSPFRLGNVTLPNRVIRAAMYEPYALSGVPTEEIISIHERHAQGGVGLTMTGWFAVSSEGRIRPSHQVSLSECSVSDLTPLVDRVHDNGGLIGCNICFVAQSEDYPPVYRWPHGDFPEKADLDELKAKFVDAAALCKEAGFDAIELHHFIVSNFMEEEMNPRTDEYGGPSVENRARFPCELIEAISDELDGEIPLFLKQTMNPSIPVPDVVEFGKLFEEAGVDAIITFRHVFAEGEDQHDLYTMEPALALQEAVSIPVVYSCGVDDVDDLEIVMEEFELVQIGRSLLRDYDFLKKLAQGEEPDACLKCNRCHSFIYKEPSLRCVLDK